MLITLRTTVGNTVSSYFSLVTHCVACQSIDVQCVVGFQIGIKYFSSALGTHRVFNLEDTMSGGDAVVGAHSPTTLGGTRPECHYPHGSIEGGSIEPRHPCITRHSIELIWVISDGPHARPIETRVLCHCRVIE